MPSQQPRAFHAEYLVIDNEFGRVDGVLRLGPGGRSRAVVVQTHPRLSSDENLVVWPMLDLPGRGIDTFAYNNRYANSTAGTEVITVWEDIGLDVAAVVAEMRRRGYDYVVLYGYSAGGPTVAYYQAVAERGNAIFNGGAALSGFTGFFEDGPGQRERRLPPADALIFQNPTTGTGASFLARLDPSIVDESTGRRDPALDMFEPANGHDPATGAARYSPGFLSRYYRAQGARMDRLIAAAQQRREDVAAGRGRFLDDDLIVIPGIRAEPASVDLSLQSRTVAEWPLQPGGGRRVIHSDRAVVPHYFRRNRSFRDGGTVHTLRSFLSYRAVLVGPDGYNPDAVQLEDVGIVAASTNNSTPTCLAAVSVPVLVTSATGDTQVHLPQAELACNAVASADRLLVGIQGGEHDMSPAGPGSGDPRAAHLEVLADWLGHRFPGGARA